MARQPNSSPAAALFEPFKPSQLDQLRRHLLDWYLNAARDLPWRRSGDPYRIWISEIMLQQTTVATVVPYFDRFLSRFRSVRELAEADVADVLRHWEGLGYYSRARNLHRAAQVIVAQHNGQFPQTVAELLELPGIGRYTAGAIASFAFNARAPIVEANTLRLYCRLLDLRTDPRSTAGQRTLWAFAEYLLPDAESGTFNQALMEIGSQVCAISNPECEACPLRSMCRSYRANSQAEVPIAAKKPAITKTIEFAVVVRAGNSYLLRQNPDGARWAGLWDFLRFSSATAEQLVSPDHISDGPLSQRLQRELEKELKLQFGIEARLKEPLTEFSHSVTRYRIRLLCLAAEVSRPLALSGTHAWLEPERFDDIPLSTTGRQLANVVIDRVAN